MKTLTHLEQCASTEEQNEGTMTSNPAVRAISTQAPEQGARNRASDLIARLEKAEGPDRRLDRDILRVICGRVVRDETFITGGLTNKREIETAYPYRLSCWFAPHYTASVDAALTLVPRHHLWQVKQGFQSVAIVWMIETDYDDHPAPTGYATTFPALALCIAALKARQEQVRR